MPADGRGRFALRLGVVCFLLAAGGVSSLLAAGPRALRASTVTTATVVTSPAASVLVLRGHGWGHGLGLSQWGAYGYAKHGWTYDRILAHYYTGTTLGPAKVDDRPRAAGRRQEGDARLGRRLDRDRLDGSQGGARPGHARPEAEARGAGQAADSAADLHVEAAARRQRQAVPRQDPRAQRREDASGDRRARTRGVSERRRAGGDAVGLAARGAEGAGGRRALVCAGGPREGEGLRPLRRHAQPGVRRSRCRGAGDERRRRCDEGRSRALRRQGRQHALLLHLRRAHSLGRGDDRDRCPVPRLCPRPVRHGIAVSRLGARALRRGEGRQAVEAARAAGRPADDDRPVGPCEVRHRADRRRSPGDAHRLPAAHAARAALDVVHARAARTGSGREDDHLRRRRLADGLRARRGRRVAGSEDRCPGLDAGRRPAARRRRWVRDRLEATGGDAVPPRLRHGPRRAREDRRRAAGRRTGDRRRCARDDPPGARPALPCSCSSSRARCGRRLRPAPPTPAAPSASPRCSRRAPIASAAYRATASRPAFLLRSRCRETAARAGGRGTRTRAACLVARVRQHGAARGEAVVPRAGQRVVLLAGATEAVPDPGCGDRLGHRRRPSGSDGACRCREVVRRRLALPRHAGPRHVRRRGDRREPVQQRGDRRARVQRAARDREGRPGQTARSRSKARWRRFAGRSTRARA